VHQEAEGLSAFKTARPAQFSPAGYASSSSSFSADFAISCARLRAARRTTGSGRMSMNRSADGGHGTPTAAQCSFKSNLKYYIIRITTPVLFLDIRFRIKILAGKPAALSSQKYSINLEELPWRSINPQQQSALASFNRSRSRTSSVDP
jgi:hypothetical protein